MKKIIYISLGDTAIAITKLASSKFISSKNTLFINTDKLSLEQENGYPSILIGEKILKGHRAGGIKFGEKAIDESFNLIFNYITKNKYSTVIILSAAAGGTGGNIAYLASKLLQKNLSVGLFISGILPPESDSSISSDCIKQAKEIETKLLFLKIISPTKLYHKKKIPINKDENLADYIEKLNQYIIKKFTKKIRKLL